MSSFSSGCFLCSFKDFYCNPDELKTFKTVEMQKSLFLCACAVLNGLMTKTGSKLKLPKLEEAELQEKLKSLESQLCQVDLKSKLAELLTLLGFISLPQGISISCVKEESTIIKPVEDEDEPFFEPEPVNPVNKSVDEPFFEPEEDEPMSSEDEGEAELFADAGFDDHDSYVDLADVADVTDVADIVDVTKPEIDICSVIQFQGSYICPEANCGRFYSDKKHLFGHYKIRHDGDEPCPVKLEALKKRANVRLPRKFQSMCSDYGVEKQLSIPLVKLVMPTKIIRFTTPAYYSDDDYQADNGDIVANSSSDSDVEGYSKKAEYVPVGVRKKKLAKTGVHVSRGNKVVPEERYHQCEMCPEEVFEKKIGRHYMDVHNHAYFKCMRCPSTDPEVRFQRKRDLEAHHTSAHSKRGKKVNKTKVEEVIPADDDDDYQADNGGDMSNSSSESDVEGYSKKAEYVSVSMREKKLAKTGVHVSRTNKVVPEERYHKCEMCPEEIFEKKIGRHYMDMHNHAYFKCTKCPSTGPEVRFQRKRDLESHHSSAHRYQRKRSTSPVPDLAEGDTYASVGQRRKREADTGVRISRSNKVIPPEMFTKCEMCPEMIFEKTIGRHYTEIHNFAFYKCLQCPPASDPKDEVRFFRKRDLDGHESTAHASRECSKCGVVYLNLVMVRHESTCTGKAETPEENKDRVNCPECGVNVTKRVLISHMATVHQQLIACGQEGCDMRFKNRPLLVRHLRVVHDIDKRRTNYTCSKCPSLPPFTSKTNYQQHGRKIHGYDMPHTLCPKCGLDIDDRSMAKHSVRCTGEPPKGLEERKRKLAEKVQCELCPGMEEMTRKELGLHQQNEHNIPQHKCLICSSTFFELKEKLKHLKEFHSGPLMCERCGRETTVQNYKRHQTVCDNGRYRVSSLYKKYPDSLKRHPTDPTKCAEEHCEFTNKIETVVDTHYMRKHASAPCQYCGKNLNVMHINKHLQLIHKMKIEDGERLTCEQCGEQFYSTSTLRDHIDSVHDRTPKYECEYCPDKFITKRLLHYHRYRKHKTFNCKEPGCTFTTIKNLLYRKHLKEDHGKTVIRKYKGGFTNEKVRELYPDHDYALLPGHRPTQPNDHNYA